MWTRPRERPFGHTCWHSGRRRQANSTRPSFMFQALVTNVSPTVARATPEDTVALRVGVGCRALGASTVSAHAASALPRSALRERRVHNHPPVLYRRGILLDGLLMYSRTCNVQIRPYSSYRSFPIAKAVLARAGVHVTSPVLALSHPVQCGRICITHNPCIVHIYGFCTHDLT